MTMRVFHNFSLMHGLEGSEFVGMSCLSLLILPMKKSLSITVCLPIICTARLICHSLCAVFEFLINHLDLDVFYGQFLNGCVLIINWKKLFYNYPLDTTEPSCTVLPWLRFHQCGWNRPEKNISKPAQYGLG